MVNKKLSGVITIIIVIMLASSLTTCGNGVNGNSNSDDDYSNIFSTTLFDGTWNASGGRTIVFSGNTFNYKVNNATQYSGTFSVSGSKITFNESRLGLASGNFTLTATTLVLSNHTWDSNVNGTYTKAGGAGGGNTAVTLNNVIANGSASQTTTQLTLIFSQAITGLSAADITLSGVSGVSKGTLSGFGAIYILPVMITTGGTLSVTVAKTGYAISGSSKTAVIYYKSGSPILSPTGIEMVSIPSGTFTMGTTIAKGGNTYELPEHSVTLTKSFYMGKYEVTQEQYQTVMGNNPSFYGKEPAAGETQMRRPVENIIWYETLVFCNKLSRMEGLSPVYSISGSTDPAIWGTIPTNNNATWNAVIMDMSKDGYRLPTEAEWEYACRAGTTTAFNNGNDDINNAVLLNAVSWNTNNSGNKTHQVGLKTANAWGLYDMHGNVNELCWDWYNSGYYSSSPSSDPSGPTTGTSKVMRGGASAGGIAYLRSASRRDVPPSYRDYVGNGFRLVRNSNDNGSNTTVTLSGTAADGSATQTTTQLILVFDKEIPGLTAADITLSGVSGVIKGTLSNTGSTYILPISGFTESGTLTVTVKGYTITAPIFYIINVTLNSVSANGSGTQTTTQLTLTFSQAITGLTAADITLSGVSGVSKGTLSGSGPTYTLPISGFTAGGTLNVAVAKSGYAISGSPITAPIFYIINVTLNSVSANGSATQTTTQLTLTFNQAITGLTAADITLSGVSGVSKGTLSGSGPTYTLPISGFTAGGTLNVAVAKSGYAISGSPKTADIYYYVAPQQPSGWIKVADSKFEYYESIYGIAWGNNKFVVVGNGGKTAYSPDGITWTAVTVGNVRKNTIAYGNGKFVAGGNAGMIIYSTNGINWTVLMESNFGTSSIIYGIAWGKDKFVAVGDKGKIVYSPDGITWTAVGDSKFTTSDSILTIAYGNGKFVAGGSSGKMAYSSDGITWTAVTDSKFNTSSISAITWGNNKFVAVGYNGEMAYSTDGITWTAVTDSTFEIDSSVGNLDSIYCIAWGNNKFIAGGGIGKMAYSPDGITWTAVTDSKFDDNSYIMGITYGNDKFVAVGLDGKMSYSYTGD